MRDPSLRVMMLLPVFYLFGFAMVNTVLIAWCSSALIWRMSMVSLLSMVGLSTRRHVLDAQKRLKPLFLSCLRAINQWLPQHTLK